MTEVQIKHTDCVFDMLFGHGLILLDVRSYKMCNSGLRRLHFRCGVCCVRSAFENRLPKYDNIIFECVCIFCFSFFNLAHFLVSH